LIILVIIVMVYIVKQKRKVETAHSNSQRNQLTIQNFQNHLASLNYYILDTYKGLFLID